MFDMKELGANIRHIRKISGLSQEELAKKAGMSTMSIRRYENGDRIITEDTLQRIAYALGTTVNWLLPPDNYWLDEQGVEHREPMWKPSGEELDRRLKESYGKLNFDGKQKAVERVEELTEIPRYCVETTPQSPPAPTEDTDTTPPPDGPEGTQEVE